MTSNIDFRFDTDFPIDSWISLFHASEYPGEIEKVGFFERVQIPSPMSAPMKLRVSDAFDEVLGVFRVVS